MQKFAYSESGIYYNLSLDETLIRIDCYFLGSLAGGTGTECIHQIQGSSIKNFLSAIDSDTINDLGERIKNFGAEQWHTLHGAIEEFQTESFVWDETNWED